MTLSFPFPLTVHVAIALETFVFSVPITIKTGTVYNTDVGSMYALFFCQGCEECFIAYYDVEIRIPRYESTGSLISLAPRKHQSKTVFPDVINSLSPNFVKIYHQSEKRSIAAWMKFAV